MLLEITWKKQEAHSNPLHRSLHYQPFLLKCSNVQNSGTPVIRRAAKCCKNISRNAVLEVTAEYQTKAESFINCWLKTHHCSCIYSLWTFISLSFSNAVAFAVKTANEVNVLNGKTEPRPDRWSNVCLNSIPVCLLRRCVMRGTEEGEEPFPRGKKRAAPLTVRKFSLILKCTKRKTSLKPDNCALAFKQLVATLVWARMHCSYVCHVRFQPV